MLSVNEIVKYLEKISELLNRGNINSTATASTATTMPRRILTFFPFLKNIIKTFEKTAKINTARLPVNNRSIIRSSAEIMSIGFSFSLLNAVSSPTSKNSAKVFGY